MEGPLSVIPSEGVLAFKESNSTLYFEELLKKTLEDADNPNEGATEESQQDLALVPLKEKLASSNWQWRLSGITELKDALNASDTFDEPNNLPGLEYRFQFHHWLCDKNASVQRAAIELIGYFFEKCSAETAREIWDQSPLYSVILEKCLAQPRLIGHCVSCLAPILAVLDGKSFLQPIFNTLDSHLGKSGDVVVRGSAAKQVAGLLNALEKLIHLFGPSNLELKDLIARVSPYCVASDVCVKKAAYAVLLELFKWTRSEDLVCCSLQDKQKGELVRRCNECQLSDPLVPSHRFRKEPGTVSGSHCGMLGANVDANGSCGEQHSPPAVSGLDVFECLPEVDILKSISPERWEKSISTAEKWKDKQEAFEMLTQACERARRLKPGDYSTFIAVILRTMQTEGNIVVTVASIRACTSLAKGLRKAFGPYTKSIASAALTKLRDRNKPILSAVLSLLSVLLLCSPFDVYLEDITRIMYDKQPNARECVLQWCIQVLQHPSQVDAVDRCFSKFVTFALDSLDDASVEVRDKGAQLLGALLDSPKADIANRAIETLAPKKAQTVHDIMKRLRFEQGSELSKCPSPVKKPEQKKVGIQRRSAIKLSGRQRGNSLAPKHPRTPPRDLVEPHKEVSSELTLDFSAAEESVATWLEPKTLSNLSERFNNRDWRVRVAALEQCIDIFTTHKPPEGECSVRCESLCIWLRHAAMKNFGETNVNVNKAAVLLATALPRIYAPHFTKPCANMFIMGFSDKLSDAKLGPLVKDLILCYAEQFSPHFILGCVFSGTSGKTPTPKVRIAICSLAESFITQFGARSCGPQSVVDFARATLDARSTVTKTAAMRLLAILYHGVGPTLSKLLGADPASITLLNDIITTASTITIDTHFFQNTKRPSFVEDVLAQHPSSLQRSEKLPSQLIVKQETDETGSSASVERNSGSRPVGTLKPYVTSSFLKSLSDPKWTIRKESAQKLREAITQQVNGNAAIAHQGLTELFVVLRGRIQHEPNRSVMREILLLVRVLGEALGPAGVKHYVRMILPTVFQKFSDKTPAIREDCTAVALIWLKLGGLSQWLSSLLISQTLSGSGDEREPLVEILAGLDATAVRDVALGSPEGKASLQTLLPIMMEFLLYRSKSLRLNAETFLVQLAPHLPPNYFQKAFKTLRPAVQSGARTIVSQCIERSSTGAMQESYASAVSTPSGETTAHSGVTLSDFECQVQHTEVHTNTTIQTRASTVPTHSNEFVLKLTALSHVSALSKLEAYRKARWTNIPGPEDVELLIAIWKTFANDKLVSAMFEKAQSPIYQCSAFKFWESYFVEQDKLRLILYPHGTGDQSYLIDLVIRWLVVRVTDSNVKSSLAACTTFLTLMESLTNLLHPESNNAEYNGVSTILLYSALPQLLERLPLVSGGQLKEKLQQTIRSIVVSCHPQSTFLILMRTTGSPNKKVVAHTLEELAALFQAQGPDVCHNIKRDVAKLAALASGSADTMVKTAALRALAILHQFMGYPLMSYIPQSDIRDKLALFLKRHPPSTFQAQSGPSETVLIHPLEMAPTTAEVTVLNKTDIASSGEQHHDNSLSISGVCGVPDASCFRGDSDHCPSTDLPDTPLQSNTLYEKLGIRDYKKEFESVLGKLGTEASLYATQQSLQVYAEALRDKERCLFVQDLMEECRRVMEGRLQPNASHIAYWNGVMRLEDTKYSVNGQSLVLMDLLRTLNRPDPLTIAQSAQSLYEIFEAQRNFDAKQSSAGQRQHDWQVIFASELINGLIFSLGFCFDTGKVVRTSEEKDALWGAGAKVTQLASRVLRNKGVLQRISLLQLRDLYRAVIVAMASHSHWVTCGYGEDIAKRLNSIIARDLMAIVIPRNACHLLSMIFGFLLGHQKTMNAPLVLRVHRKLINKLNSKHSNQILSAEEIPYYLRTLDVAILALKQLDSDPLFSQVTGLRDLPPDVNTHDPGAGDDHTEKLKGQVEFLIKEIVFMAIVILGPALAGVYFRDLGFVEVQKNSEPPRVKDSTPLIPYKRSEDTKIPQRLNRRLSSRLETLMNTPFSVDMVAAVCPAIRSQPAQLCGKDNVPSYSMYYEWFHNQQDKTTLQTALVEYPPFTLSYFLSMAPDAATLDTVDPSLAAGWPSRRDSKAGLDVQHIQELLPAWSAALNEAETTLTVKTNKELARTQAANAMSQGLVHYELVGKYVRKAMAIASDCGLVTRSDSLPETGLHSHFYP